MTASQSGLFSLQQFSDVGAPLVGGRLYTYAYGTTTHKTAYTDKAGTIAHSYTSDGAGGQYIALNARGELPAPLYLTYGSYDIALKRADGSTVWTRRAEPMANYLDEAVAAATSAAAASAAAAAASAASAAVTTGANTFTGAQTLPRNAVNPLEAVPLQQLPKFAVLRGSGAQTASGLGFLTYASADADNTLSANASSGQITPDIAGRYLIVAQVSIGSGSVSATEYCYIRLQKWTTSAVDTGDESCVVGFSTLKGTITFLASMSAADIAAGARFRLAKGAGAGASGGYKIDSFAVVRLTP
jgi:hypothetical protein